MAQAANVNFPLIAFQGQLNGSQEAETNYYLYRKGQYLTQLTSYFPRQVREIRSKNFYASTNISPYHIPSIVLEYLGINDQNGKKFTYDVTCHHLDRLMPHIHSLFESMVHCELQCEQKEGWRSNKFNDLNSRQLALKNGKDAAQKYLLKLFSDIHPDTLSLWTKKHAFSDEDHVFPKYPPLFLHIPEGILRNIANDILDCKGEITLPFLLALIEKHYKSSLDDIIDTVVNDFIENVLHHLTDINEIESVLKQFLNKLFVLVIYGLQAFKENRKCDEAQKQKLLLFLNQFFFIYDDDDEIPLDSIKLFVSPLVKASMESSFEAVNNSIEHGINFWIKSLKSWYGDKKMKEDIGPNHLKYWIAMIRNYRDGFLYTLLAGLKKERAGMFSIHPSHFHKHFHEYFLKRAIKEAANFLKGGIKAIKQEPSYHILEASFKIAPLLETWLKDMKKQFNKE